MVKIITTDIFIERAKLIHLNKFSYENVIYKNCREKIEITCPTHGSFWQKPKEHLANKGCKECQYSDTARGNLRKSRNITFGDAYKETLNRIKDIKETGYNIVYIWESEYHKTIKGTENDGTTN